MNRQFRHWLAILGAMVATATHAQTTVVGTVVRVYDARPIMWPATASKCDR